MNYLKLIFKNLLHYRGKNLALALGGAVSAAVLTGAIMVGDSVQYNLNKIIDYRLGAVTHTLTAGDRYFTSSLANRLETETEIESAPILMLDGMAVAHGGQHRVNRIQVVGVDNRFDQVMKSGINYSNLLDDEVVISTNLAKRLNVGIGDEVLFRIKKASLIPLNAPFVSSEETTKAIRLKIKALAGKQAMGQFNLRMSQTAPFNAFVSHEMLNLIMEMENKANVILMAGNHSVRPEKIYNAIQKQCTLEDLNLKLEYLKGKNLWNLNSQRVFIDSITQEGIEKLSNNKQAVLTYFVNQFKFQKKETPYSFVSTLPDEKLNIDEIIINKWLADDLEAKVGDTIFLKYFVVGPLKSLTEKQGGFVVKHIVGMKDELIDETLMPYLPGLSDAGNCRDWETGVPIQLERIRDKDEDYWNRWRGTPKAFISTSKAVDLWGNRFGNLTAFRIEGAEEDKLQITEKIKENIDARSIGFKVDAHRQKSLASASGGVDFSGLFGALSFFILVAGIVLIILLFLLNLDSRKEQLKTLRALGIPSKKIRMILLAEGTLVAALGALIGLLFAIGYTRLVFMALNSIWFDIVRAQQMEPVITNSSLFFGWVLSLLVAAVTIYFSVSGFTRNEDNKHRISGSHKKVRRVKLVVSFFAGCSAVFLIGYQLFLEEAINSAIFFSAGGVLIISLLLWIDLFMRKLEKRASATLNIWRLSWKNALRNRVRSISIISIFAIGTFLVISTGANRKDIVATSQDRLGGTGGYMFFAESTVPVLKDLNNKAVRNEYGLEKDFKVVPLRKMDGDDASCLNLNRVSNPQILGVAPEKLAGRFSFVSKTQYLDEENPWLSLHRNLPGDCIPAIADQTVIKWGLGMKVGDTLTYTNESGKPLKLILIGGLANSIFQGNVLISNSHFLENYPTHSGANLFLIDFPETSKLSKNLGSFTPEYNDAIQTELQRTFRDNGWEMVPAAQRLAEFNSVENTYLSIFMVMGALGLLLGTGGLGVVLVRSLMERRNEIALLKAVGFGSRKVLKMIMIEYLALLSVGIILGTVTSTIATLPSIISPNTDISFQTILIILGILLINGLFWIYILTRKYLADPRINLALRND